VKPFFQKKMGAFCLSKKHKKEGKWYKFESRAIDKVKQKSDLAVNTDG
jgi:hypothetical protein